MGYPKIFLTVYSKANDDEVVHITKDETVFDTKTFDSKISGVITYADALYTPRTISLVSGASGSVVFDGSMNVNLEVTELKGPLVSGVVSSATVASKLNPVQVGTTNIPVYVTSDGVVTPTNHDFTNYLLLAGGTMTGLIKGTITSAYQASNASYAEHVGSDNIGTTDNPVYVNLGVVTPTNHNFQDYLRKDGGVMSSGAVISGTITYASSAGSAAFANKIESAIANIGNSDTPVYVSNGSIKSTEKHFSNYMLSAGGIFVGDVYGVTPNEEEDINNKKLVNVEYIQKYIVDNNGLSSSDARPPKNLNTIRELAESINNDNQFYKTLEHTTVHKTGTETIAGDKTFTQLISGVITSAQEASHSVNADSAIHATNADLATNAITTEKVGSNDIGTENIPVYVNLGVVKPTIHSFEEYLRLDGGTMAGDINVSNGVNINANTTDIDDISKKVATTEHVNNVTTRLENWTNEQIEMVQREVGIYNYKPTPYIKFEATTGNLTISAVKGWNKTVEVSYDNEYWMVWEGNEINDSPVLYFRGSGNSTFSESHVGWVVQGDKVKCTGNIESLQDYTAVINGEHPGMKKNCFKEFFFDCVDLIEAPALPNTMLSEGCYSSMFKGCSSLKQAPILPATVMMDYCYDSMFMDCVSLTHPPFLPGITLAIRCYHAMFAGCTSIKTAPSLIAQTLVEGCYEDMFNGCAGIKISETKTSESSYKAYYFPVTTVENWNARMFEYTGGEFKGSPVSNKQYYANFIPLATLNYEVENLKDITANHTSSIIEINEELTKKADADKYLPLTGGILTGDLLLNIPTTSISESNNKVATTAYVKNAINNLINGALPSLDTLSELGSALNNDKDFAAHVTQLISYKAFDSEVVHNTKDETISGIKTFTVKPTYNGSPLVAMEDIYPIDSEINSSSIHPVQNKVIYSALETKANDSTVVHLYNDEVIDGSKQFIGDVFVPFVEITDSSLKAATTNFVQSNISELDSKVVHLAQNESIYGLKIFATRPKVFTGTVSLPVALTTDIPTVENTLDSSSVNPVQNKIIKQALDTKANNNEVVHTSGDEIINGLKTFTTPVSGTMEKAKQLATARTIFIVSGANGSASFDGSSDVSLEITRLDGSKVVGAVTSATIASKLQNGVGNNNTPVYVDINGVVSKTDMSFNDYLPLSGGTITNSLTVNGELNAVTQLEIDSSTKVATTEFVKIAVANVVNNAPETLDTLKELASALGNNPNFATTMTEMLGSRALKTEVVHIQGNEQIDGIKTFTTKPTVNGVNVALESEMPVVDTAISSDSTNPVQNKVIYNALSKKANESNVVHITNNDTISGIKTFTGTIIVPDMLLTDSSTNAANTKYVHSAMDSINSSVVHLTGDEFITGNKYFDDIDVEHTTQSVKTITVDEIDCSAGNVFYRDIDASNHVLSLNTTSVLNNSSIKVTLILTGSTKNITFSGITWKDNTPPVLSEHTDIITFLIVKRNDVAIIYGNPYMINAYTE